MLGLKLNHVSKRGHKWQWSYYMRNQIPMKNKGNHFKWIRLITRTLPKCSTTVLDLYRQNRPQQTDHDERRSELSKTIGTQSKRRNGLWQCKSGTFAPATITSSVIGRIYNGSVIQYWRSCTPSRSIGECAVPDLNAILCFLWFTNCVLLFDNNLILGCLWHCVFV